MPICDKCQTPYVEWQLFCLQCGQYLTAEPQPSPRCPQCGIRTTLEQNFCHECAAPLTKDMALLAPPLLKEDAVHLTASPSSWKKLAKEIAAALLGLGVVILAWYLIRQPWTIPAPTVESPVLSLSENPAVSGEGNGKEARTADSNLRAEFEEVFNQIKKANLAKNILLYMNALSAVYPGLDKKRQEISKTWEKYEFKEMAFTVNKIQEVGDGEAVVEMHWNTSTQNLATKDLRTDDFQYRVWFVKELGHWKIKKIEELQA